MVCIDKSRSPSDFLPHHPCDLRLCHDFHGSCSFPLLLAQSPDSEGQHIGVSPPSQRQVSTSEPDAKWSLKCAVG